MPKVNRKNKSKRMRGGFDMSSLNPFGSSNEVASSTGTSWLGSLTEKAKSASGSASGWFSSSPTTAPPATSAYPANPPAAPAYGGRKRRSNRMRGGYSSNISTTNLAASAGSFSGSTARAQAYVGGRTKKRCRRHKRSHRRNCRK
jgi:hypothetical protein